jgi:hypothetical protein
MVLLILGLEDKKPNYTSTFKMVVTTYDLLYSGVLSRTADTTVKVCSVIIPQLMSLAVHLGVAVKVASTTLETNTHREGQYGLGGT